MLNNSWEVFITKLNKINGYGLNETDIEYIASYISTLGVDADGGHSHEIVESLIEEYKKINFSGSNTSR